MWITMCKDALKVRFYAVFRALYHRTLYVNLRVDNSHVINYTVDKSNTRKLMNFKSTLIEC